MSESYEPRIIGEKSRDSANLYDFLKKHLEDGKRGTITYKELNQVSKRNVTNIGRGCLETAKRAIERDFPGILFDTVWKTGIRILEPDEQPTIGFKATKRISKTAKKALRRMSRSKYAEMNLEARTQHNLTASFLGAVEQFSRPKSQERLKGAVINKSALLDFTQTLDLFRANGNTEEKK